MIEILIFVINKLYKKCLNQIYYCFFSKKKGNIKNNRFIFTLSFTVCEAFNYSKWPVEKVDCMYDYRR